MRRIDAGVLNLRHGNLRTDQFTTVKDRNLSSFYLLVFNEPQF